MFTRGHINHQPAMDICWGYGRLVTWRMKPPILASERSLLLLAEDFFTVLGVYSIYIYGYGSIPINTIFRGMNIHLPAILMFTRCQGFDPSPYMYIHIFNCICLVIFIVIYVYTYYYIYTIEYKYYYTDVG